MWPKGVQVIWPHLLNGAGSVTTASGAAALQSWPSTATAGMVALSPVAIVSALKASAHLNLAIGNPFTLLSGAAQSRPAQFASADLNVRRRQSPQAVFALLECL